MKTVVVTGATSGIGFAVAQAMLALGWRVLLVGHTRENSEKAIDALREAFPQGEMACFSGDLNAAPRGAPHLRRDQHLSGAARAGQA